MQCNTGKVEGNLKALPAFLPERLDTTAVIQYMPTLLLSDIKKVRSTLAQYLPAVSKTKQSGESS